MNNLISLVLPNSLRVKPAEVVEGRVLGAERLNRRANGGHRRLSLRASGFHRLVTGAEELSPSKCFEGVDGGVDSALYRGHRRKQEAASIGRFVRQYVNVGRGVLAAQRLYADEPCDGRPDNRPLPIGGIRG